MHFFAYVCLLFVLPGTPQETIAQEVALGINTYINYTKRIIPKTHSFLELVSQGLFVDKTLLINDILEKPHWHYIITCPNKWGKTMNLDMLKTFVQMQVHANGSRVLPISGTPAYQLFTTGECRWQSTEIKLRKTLLISNPKYKPIIDKYLGQHPVIHLTFSGMPWVGEKRALMLNGIIAKSFKEHEYMLEIYDSIINDDAFYSYEKQEVQDIKQNFVKYMNGESENTNDLVKAIEFLRDQLYDHFKIKVFILIDEYDRILEINRNISTLDYFFSHTLRKHEALEKAILTGTIRKSFDLHDVYIHTFSDSPYYPYYGFIQDEMNLLYNYFEIPTEKRKMIQYWYGGYRVPNAYINETIYNPWSVCKYLNTGYLKPYWIEINSRDINLQKIIDSPNFQHVFSRLINGKGYFVNYASYSRTARTYNTFDLVSDITQTLQYFKGTGYLTVQVENPKIPFFYKYKIPNYEIASYLPTIFAAKTNRLLKNRYHSLLRNIASIWEQCLLSNEPSAKEIENHTRKHFEILANYFEQEYHLGTIDSWVLTLVMATYTSKEFTFICWQYVHLPNNGKDGLPRRPNMVFTSKHRGFIIHVNYLKRGENISTVDYTDQYLKMFEEYPKLHGWNDILFMTFNLLANDTLSINTHLYVIS